MKYKDAIDQLNQELAKHVENSGFNNSQTGLNSRSPGVQMLNQKHADKAKVASRTAFNQAHSKPAAGNQLKPLGHIPTLKQLEAQAQASALKPKK